ncbi:MAG: AraC family transcriptional regulator [Ruminococcus flavefaciens]|nr:AraC family transcriptional regulator [Ruminococcus flavefaciens]MCM1229352.1 AraC family transcriptional regulator [Ruminococcus flavefaciens]
MNDSSMTSHLFDHREEEFRYAPFDREMAFYESICSGNMELVKMFVAPLFCEGCGTLSKDSLRNLKYHFTITTALIARFCVNSGMTPEEAYSISDIYIMRADECDDEAELRRIHADMIESYTRKMRRVRTGNIYSKRIVRAVDYISEHLHSRIRVEDVAEYLKINPAYLSRVFRAETGMTFTDYVNRKKIEEATGLLSYSEYSDLEISSLLCFSSQSYFIKIFKKYIGITPKEYKKKYRFSN